MIDYACQTCKYFYSDDLFKYYACTLTEVYVTSYYLIYIIPRTSILYEETYEKMGNCQIHNTDAKSKLNLG